MGTRGMSYSLQSRDPHRRLHRDGDLRPVVRRERLHPRLRQEHAGVMMAIGRMNRPALMVYGGTIKSGRISGDKPVDIVNAFQSYGQYLAGSIDESERFEIVRNACPGAGGLRGHVHRQHDGLGDRGDGHVAPLQLLDPGRRCREARRVLPGRRGGPQPPREGPQAPRHHDPGGVRERDGGGHGPRRVDERGAPSHRRWPGRWRCRSRSTTSRP